MDDNDRISDLPDFILGGILSFLPTEEAVATSILSKRWRSTWVLIHNLDFYHMRSRQNDEKFIAFVNHVFLHVHASPLLNSFRLAWYTCHIGARTFADSWINTAIATNIQMLSLLFRCNAMFHVPLCVFSCASLQCLELNGLCAISLPTSFVVCLPRLNKLILTEIRFQSQHVFENLIDGCPMLTDLQLKRPCCCGFTYNISSTSLRRLSLGYVECSLWLEALPSLEYLKLFGRFVPKHFLFTSPSSRVEVEFAISWPYHYSGMFEALHACDWANTLTLSVDSMLALSHARVNPSNKLNSLVKLTMDVPYCDWRSLQYLIEQSDNLQLLTIHQDLDPEKIIQRRWFKWTTPALVPRCLTNSLKRIVFNGYHGNVEYEHEMIRYLLAHGSVLEVMWITCAGKKSCSKLKKIGMYPRKSPFCAVKFSGAYSSNNFEM